MTDAGRCFQPGHQLCHTLAHQRFATGHPHRVDAALRKQRSQTQKFFVGEQSFPFQFFHAARDEFAAVQAGLRAALDSPLPVKLNCVPQVGVNEDELEAIAALARDNDLQVRFIEMMPIGYGAAMPCVSGPELRARFANRWPELHPVEGTTFGNGPAVYYTVPGWKGSIGFIAAVHGKFCTSCNRVRLTSQGFLRPCLASETGCDLRALLRGGADDARLRTAIRETIWSKPREHHFEDRCMPATRSMYRIGG